MYIEKKDTKFALSVGMCTRSIKILAKVLGSKYLVWNRCHIQTNFVNNQG